MRVVPRDHEARNCVLSVTLSQKKPLRSRPSCSYRTCAARSQPSLTIRPRWMLDCHPWPAALLLWEVLLIWLWPTLLPQPCQSLQSVTLALTPHGLLTVIPFHLCASHLSLTRNSRFWSPLLEFSPAQSYQIVPFPPPYFTR